MRSERAELPWAAKEVAGSVRGWRTVKVDLAVAVSVDLVHHLVELFLRGRAARGVIINPSGCGGAVGACVGFSPSVFISCFSSSLEIVPPLSRSTRLKISRNLQGAGS